LVLVDGMTFKEKVHGKSVECWGTTRKMSDGILSGFTTVRENRSVEPTFALRMKIELNLKTGLKWLTKSGEIARFTIAITYRLIRLRLKSEIFHKVS
jgi:hypothetical protein